MTKDLADEQIFWMDKAKEYSKTATALSPAPWKEQWMQDALYTAYLHGVEDARGIRIIS